MLVDLDSHPVDLPGPEQTVSDVLLSASLCHKLLVTPESSHRVQTWGHLPPIRNNTRIIGLF